MEDKTVRQKMNQYQRRQHYFLTDLMQELHYDLHYRMTAEGWVLPSDWQEIADAPARGKKERMTLRLDSDVVKFFRGTGQGFQTRMNDVLRAFMHARLSGMIEDGARFQIYAGDKPHNGRPMIGETEYKRKKIKRALDGSG